MGVGIFSGNSHCVRVRVRVLSICRVSWVLGGLQPTTCTILPAADGMFQIPLLVLLRIHLVVSVLVLCW